MFSGDRERGQLCDSRAPSRTRAAWLPGANLAADRSEMQRHGLGVRRRHDPDLLRRGAAEQAAPKQVGPIVALVRAGGAGPCATLGPDAGQRALLADPSLILETRFRSACLLGAVGDLRRDCRGEVFFKHLLGLSSSSLRVTGPYRQFCGSRAWLETFPTERSWSATHRSAAAIRRARSTPPPSHDPRAPAGSGPASTSSANSACCRAVSFDPGQPGDLRLRSPVSSRGVVTVHPVSQGLTVHAAGFSRRLAVQAIEHQRKRKYPTRPRQLFFSPPRRLAKLRKPVRSSRVIDNPPFPSTPLLSKESIESEFH